MQIIPFTISLCILTTASAIEIDLLNLKSNWLGKGVSLLYPKQMQLLSNKLTMQAGMMTTFTPIPAGDIWQLSGTISLKCLNSDVMKEEADVGVAVWLTKNSLRPSVVNYNYDDFRNNFGLTNSIDGLSMAFYRNNIYTALFNKNEIQREELMLKSKVCRGFLEKEQAIGFSIKYRANVLGIYYVEQKDRLETLCFQFTDIPSIDEFYLSFGATDRQSKCGAHVTNLILTSEFPDYNFVTGEEKRPEDGRFAYFASDPISEQKIQFDHLQKVYDYYRENAKIFAKQLLQFADKNEKELIADIKSEIANTDAALEKAIVVVEDQAKQVETLNTLLTNDRKQINDNVNVVLDQILQWMAQMDESFDKVEVETARVQELLSKSSLDEQLDTLINKTRSVGQGLARVLEKTKAINTHQELGQLDENKLTGWGMDIFGFFTDVKQTVHNNTQERVSRLRMVGLGLLVGIALLVVIAFCVMYIRIRNAMKYKRIL